MNYDIDAIQPNPIVLYHSPCLDGAMSAYLAFLRWPSAELVPQAYGAPPPRATPDASKFVFSVNREDRVLDVRQRDLIILDYSYPRVVLETLKLQASSLRVYDHHDTAEKELDGLPFAFFDQSRSGAGLALDHFHSGARLAVGLGQHSPLPYSAAELAILVESRDLWKFDVPGAREVCAYLEAEDVARDPMKFERLPPLVEMGIGGKAMLMYQAGLVSRLASHSDVCKWEEGDVLVSNAPVLQSEVGTEMYSKKAPAPLKTAICWYETAEAVFVSLRSADDGADVGAMAKKRGGGGHKHAAGFKIPHRGPWRYSPRQDRNVHRDEVAPVGGPS